MSTCLGFILHSKLHRSIPAELTGNSELGTENFPPLLLNSAAMDFRARQQKLREHLTTTRFDALLISHLPNLRYLCGFTGSAGLLLVEEAGSVFFSDVRYDTQAHEEVKAAKVVITRKALLSGFGEWLGARRKRSRGWTIGLEAEHCTIADKKRLTEVRPAGVRLKDAPSVVERARMVKDSDELVRIRFAVVLGAKLFDRALEVLRPGVKETEVAAEMEYTARRAGAEEMSFPTIIASEARPCGRSHPAGSSYATSVLYSQVIVPTRLALYGSVPRRIRHAMLTRQCGQRGRRQSIACALASPSVTSTAPLVKCCTRLV